MSNRRADSPWVLATLLPVVFACSCVSDDPECVVNAETVRLQGVVVGDDISEGPIRIRVYEEVTGGCGSITTPGDIIGEVETAVGEGFDFEVTVKYSGVNKPNHHTDGAPRSRWGWDLRPRRGNGFCAGGTRGCL